MKHEQEQLQKENITRAPGPGFYRSDQVEEPLSDALATDLQPKETVEQHLSEFALLVAKRKRFYSFVCVCWMLYSLLFWGGSMITNQFQTRQSEALKKELTLQHEWIDALGSTQAQQTRAINERAFDEFDKAYGEAHRRADPLKPQVDKYAREYQRLGTMITTTETAGLCLGLLILAVHCSLFLAGARVERRQRRRIHSLAMSTDLRVIGPLIEALAPVAPPQQSVISNEKQRRQVMAVLTHLLPRLQAADAALLSEEQRSCLARALGEAKVEKDSALMVAILKTFERIGDGRIEAVVEKLAGLKGQTLNEQRVLEAAQECLPSLRAYAEQDRLASTLLRSTNTPVDPAGVLLRPTPNAVVTDPDLLLRSVESAVVGDEDAGRE